MKSFRKNFCTTKKIFRDKTGLKSYKKNTSQKSKILIADRNIQDAKVLKKFLGSKGYTTLLVDRWKYLLLEIKRTDITVLFLDVKLLDIQGYKLIPLIKMIRPDISIIITNSTNSLETETLVRNHNIFFYYLKPYYQEEVSLLIKNAITESYTGNC